MDRYRRIHLRLSKQGFDKDIIEKEFNSLKSKLGYTDADVLRHTIMYSTLNSEWKAACMSTQETLDIQTVFMNELLIILTSILAAHDSGDSESINTILSLFSKCSIREWAAIINATSHSQYRLVVKLEHLPINRAYDTPTITQ